jgi:hypothetical protein
MNRLLVGLVSAAALATTVLLVRQQKDDSETRLARLTSGWDKHPPTISLERMRELGL